MWPPPNCAAIHHRRLAKPRQDRLMNGELEFRFDRAYVFICKLRKKLARASGGKNYIETVWGRGYMMREQGEVAAPISA
jgi:DNA-binding response OmpR family regulator